MAAPVPVPGRVPAAAPHSPTRDVASDSAEARKLQEPCPARKFETDAQLTHNGATRPVHIRLCAKPGATEAQWRVTLLDARARLRALDGLTADARSRIEHDIDAAVAKLAAPAVAK